MTGPTRPEGAKQSHLDTIVDAWCAFWFTPQPAYVLGLIRMTFGVVVVAWTLAALPDLFQVFGKDGAAPKYVPLEYQWSVFELFTGDRALLIGWAVLLLSAIALTVGWHSRLTAILVFVLLTSVHRRGALIYNAGDSVIAIIALVVALSCCGAALSLDQRRRTGSFWSAQTLAPWPVRLLQVQMTLIYLVSVQSKLYGGRDWVDGSAAFYAWRTDGRWALLAVPEWLSSNAIVSNVASWGTLLVELAIAVLVWNKRCRFWVLGAGVVLHLVLMVTMSVGFFSLAMFVLYLAFVPPDAVQAMPDKLKAWWRRRRSSSAPPPQEPAAT